MIITSDSGRDRQKNTQTYRRTGGQTETGKDKYLRELIGF